MQRTKNIEELIEGFKLIRQYLRPTVCSVPKSITHSQWLALAVIGRGDCVTVRDLRTTLGISSSAASQLVNNLEKKRYVKRIDHATDGRASVLALTAPTKKTFAAMRQQKLKEFGQLFNALSDDELTSYMALHRKLIKSIT